MVTVQYDAFISYRHVRLDRRIARRLHRLLEIYKPPKPLQNLRIRKIFIDHCELPTSSDLGQQITTALDNSRFLVIICSPDYLLSRYCEAELNYFLKINHGDTSHVLVVIARGDPKDVFPKQLFTPPEDQDDVLCCVEPMGADVRSRSLPGALIRLQSSYIRIAAPLLGCGYDDLYQRHLRRKRMRRIRIAISCAVLLIAAAAYGMFKNRQIVEQTSLKQKQQAHMVYNAIMTLLSKDNGKQADELKAMLLGKTYAQSAGLAGQPEVLLGLSNAAVQMAVAENTTPFPRVLYEDYPYETEGLTEAAFFYIAPSDTILFADYRNAKRTLLLDAKTGAVLLDVGECKLSLTKNNHYLLCYENSLTEDQSGVEQTVTLYDLFQTRMVFKRAFREVSKHGEISTRACGSDGPFAIMDGETCLYAFDNTGVEMSSEAFNTRWMEGAKADRASGGAPFSIVKRRTGIEIHDGNEAACFTLPSGTKQYSFSSDYSRFAYADNQVVRIVDTASWQEAGAVAWNDSEYLLGISFVSSDARLICLALRDKDAAPGSDENYVRVYDIQNGKCLLPNEPGTPPAQQDESRFYLCYQGKLSAFQFNASLADEQADVISISVDQDIAIVRTHAATRMIRVSTGETVASWGRKASVVTSADMSGILVASDNQSLMLYRADGTIRWKCESENQPTAYAISTDGEQVAVADGAQVTLVNANGALLASYPISFTPTALSTDNGLVYAGDGDHGVLLGAQGQIEMDGDLPHADCRMVDGLLILNDASMEVRNFAVCDLSGKVRFRPVNSVYRYQYSAAAHILAIQERSLNGYPVPTVSLYHTDDFSPALTWTLSHQDDSFQFDETGKYITMSGSVDTTVYRTADGSVRLHYYGTQACLLGDRLYALKATPEGIFSQALDTESIMSFATNRLTSNHGERTMLPSEEVLANDGQ